MLFEVMMEGYMIGVQIKPMEEAFIPEGLKTWHIDIQSLEELISLEDRFGAFEISISFTSPHKCISINKSPFSIK